MVSSKSFLNFGFSLFLIGPLAVLFWRGTFNTIYNIAFSDLPSISSRWLPALLLFIIGLSAKITLDILKQILRPILADVCFTIQYISGLILIYCDATTSVIMWVGGFNLLYIFPSLYWYSLVSVHVVSVTILMSVKAFHCTSGTPLTISTDSFSTIFSPSSYFGTNLNSSGPLKMCLDTVFSYTVIHSLVIAAWWSMWELENRYILYPCEITVKDFQAWDSVVLAYFFSFVVVFLDASVKEMSESGDSWRRSFTNFIAFLAFLASLNFWRGIWSLQDFYFFPEMNVSDNLVLSHVVGFIGTFLFQASLTLTQSSQKDSESPSLFACDYWLTSRPCGSRQSDYEELG